MVASRENFPLLAELLADQQRLDTPVARFSTAHDAGAQVTALGPQLIPLSKPGPGEQYAFEVDLDSCTGCKSCVAACHSLNGLDDTETWRDIGLLVSPSRAHPFTQTVTGACHHCADPACLNGCPVLAYEKDPVTGIVVHLDDQCIGCGYCVLKCPYDVPKFSERLGIVRKCDMCHGRLAAGEAPACAQACPTHAIRIVTVQNRKPETGSRITRPNPDRLGFELSGVRFPQSGIADPAYTQPTTRYVSKRQLPPDLAAADVTALRVQPAHWPLVLMLTAMPAAVGLQLAVALPLLVGARLRAMPSASAIANTLAPTPDQQNLLLIAAILGAMGLFASVFHLGQPWRAWRIFLGWRKSWLSREAMLFAPWFALTSAIPILHWSLDIGHWSFPVAAACLGVAGLTCSAMIYVDTHRQFWRATQTFPRFFGTAVLVAATLLAPAVAALLLVAKLGWETRTQSGGSPSARLQNGPLRPLATARVGLALATSVLLVVIPGPWLLVPLLAGELAERLLFFRAVDAPKMPGVPSA